MEVHYDGWSARWDEWVLADKVLTKQQQVRGHEEESRGAKLHWTDGVLMQVKARKRVAANVETRFAPQQKAVAVLATGAVSRAAAASPPHRPVPVSASGSGMVLCRAARRSQSSRRRTQR